MKRLLCAIAMLVAFIPFVGVKALNETTNYYSYKKGQIVNFYPNATEEAARNKKALETMIVEDKDTSSRFIKVWIMGGGVYSGSSADQTAAFINQYKTAYIDLLSKAKAADGLGVFPTTGAETDEKDNYMINFNDTSKGMDLITLDDLKTMFGDALSPVLTATTGTTDPSAALVDNTDNYTLSDVEIVNRVGEKTSLYDELELVVAVAKKIDEAGAKRGFYVLERNASGGIKQMWIAEFTWNGNDISGIQLRKAVTADANTTYLFMPTVYVNKTADCHEETPENHCYKCVNENGKFIFKWTTAGDKEVEKCEVQNDITSKKDCSELVKTGVESHILEFAIVAALCVIALIVVKRKDLFKTI